jgi:hypothetical protein
MKPAMNTAYTAICPKRANGVYAPVSGNGATRHKQTIVHLKHDISQNTMCEPHKLNI